MRILFAVMMLSMFAYGEAKVDTVSRAVADTVVSVKDSSIVEVVEEKPVEKVVEKEVIIIKDDGEISSQYKKRTPIEKISKYDAKAHVFIVTKPYVVAEDEVLVIPAGSKVQFDPVTGIDVKGGLLIDGAVDRNVILTSRKGMQGLGAAYDWIGIRLFSGARAVVRYSVISYASVGIRTCCDNVTLVNAVFFTNGVNFQVDDRRMYVPDREPFNHDITPIDLSAKSKAATTPPPKVNYDDLIHKTYLPPRTIALSVATLAALTGGIIYTVKWVDAVDDYNKLRPGDPRWDDIDERKRAFKDLDKKITLNSILGLGLSAVGVGLGTYTVIYTVKF